VIEKNNGVIFMKIFMSVIMIAFAAVLAMAQVESPTEINLKEAWEVQNATRDAVVFKHAFHQENNQCIDCHDSEEGGNKLKPEGEIKGMMAKNPAHAQCWPCHTKKRIPGMQNCVKCHAPVK
jgi:c(7)-type cytochrome triheme protein